MIQFFKKIRQNLLSTGKTGQYLKYAFGEITLVVIGILIALQFNNWNEQRKNVNMEARYVKSLQEQLEIQVQVIDNQIKEENAYIESAEYIIDEVNQGEKGKTKFDQTFYFNLTHLNKRTTFKIVDATYVDLISTGKLDLFSEEDTKNKIIAYYQELERVEAIIHNNNIQIVDHIFAPTAQRLGFYQFDSKNSELISNHPSANILESFDPDLAAYSSNLILEQENKLMLSNLLKQRLVVGIFHDALMKELKSKSLILKEHLEHLNQ
jgi:hypothetical protein